MATSLDRLVRKEVSLGAIRELPVQQNHIGLQLIAPWLEVGSDDVIFQYIKDNAQEGLAPARAEDAEAELAQKDDLLAGEGRASLIDWSLKDKYTASDVSRYRSDLRLEQQLNGTISADLPRSFSGSTVADFQKRLAREDVLRKRKLDNRIEWLIMTAFETGKLEYNDGKIKFAVDFGRPADQHLQTPAGGEWGTPDSDPIGDLIEIDRVHFDKYGVHLTRGVISKKILNSIWKSKYFLLAMGVPLVGGTPSVPVNPDYLGLQGYTPENALRILEAATGITFTVYDGIYRTRPIGSQVITNTRFTTESSVILWPGEGELGEIDDTEIGFAKTLTSPHPEGNWTPGFYEWENETTDPWLHVRGSGVKAFPIFPYMKYTYTLKVLA